MTIAEAFLQGFSYKQKSSFVAFMGWVNERVSRFIHIEATKLRRDLSGVTTNAEDDLLDVVIASVSRVYAKRVLNSRDEHREYGELVRGYHVKKGNFEGDVVAALTACKKHVNDDAGLKKLDVLIARIKLLPAQMSSGGVDNEEQLQKVAGLIEGFLRTGYSGFLVGYRSDDLWGGDGLFSIPADAWDGNYQGKSDLGGKLRLEKREGFELVKRPSASIAAVCAISSE